MKLLNNVIRHDKLLNTSSHLTKSYHVALGVAMHVGQDGSGSARKLEQNVENFLKKPVEWVIGPDRRCARALTRTRSLTPASLTRPRQGRVGACCRAPDGARGGGARRQPVGEGGGDTPASLARVDQGRRQRRRRPGTL